MFKLNVTKVNNNSYNLLYSVEICDLWHYCMGHVTFCKLNDIMNLDLIPLTSRHMKLALLVC